MTLPDYQVSAINDAVSSENRIHSNAVAKKFGFSGALVSGVSVFGYLTHSLVAAFGRDWLGDTVAEVKFIKPAYEGDLLTLKSEKLADQQQRHARVSAYNPSGVLLAQMESWRPDVPEAIDQFAFLPTSDSEESSHHRQEISWDLVVPNKPAPIYPLTFSSELQQSALQIMRDELEIYRQDEMPPVHPYLLLKECNKALMRMFILPAWIHVGSRLVFRQPLTLDQPLEVVTVPVEKWQSKGHQFIKLYLAFRDSQTVALEVLHTAIFRIATD